MQAIDYLGDDYVGSESGDVDYLSGKHPWPWHISFCGDLGTPCSSRLLCRVSPSGVALCFACADIVGHPKPQSVYRRVLWGVQPMGMLVHGPTAHPELPAPWQPEAFNWDWPMELESWSWHGAEGSPVGVRVFARGCQSARLTLDGKTLATAQVNSSNLTATFVVPYAPGTLQALCVNGSSVVPAINATLKTAGAAAALQLSADRSSIRQDPNDLAYVTVTVVDSAGVVVPMAARNLTLHATGAGHIEAVGSGDPSDPGSFTAASSVNPPWRSTMAFRTTWRGRALAILRPTVASAVVEQAGQQAATITLTATVPGLKGAQTVISLTE